jgi:hypothetical protein
MSDEGDLGEPDLDGIAGSNRDQTGHLTRTIKRDAALVKEAALRAPSTIFLDQPNRGHLPGFVISRRNVQQFAGISGTLRTGQRATRPTSRGAWTAMPIKRMKWRCWLHLRWLVVK